MTQVPGQSGCQRSLIGSLIYLFLLFGLSMALRYINISGLSELWM